MHLKRHVELLSITYLNNKLGESSNVAACGENCFGKLKLCLLNQLFEQCLSQGLTDFFKRFNRFSIAQIKILSKWKLL